MKYKIHVKTFQTKDDGSPIILHFSVDKYDVLDGFVVFTDHRFETDNFGKKVVTSKEKRFAVANCEIEVSKND